MATPLGQMCPRESGSSGLPRTPVTRATVEGDLEAADGLAQVADTDALLHACILPPCRRTGVARNRARPR